MLGESFHVPIVKVLRCSVEIVGSVEFAEYPEFGRYLTQDVRTGRGRRRRLAATVRAGIQPVGGYEQAVISHVTTLSRVNRPTGHRNQRGLAGCTPSALNNSARDVGQK